MGSRMPSLLRKLKLWLRNRRSLEFKRNVDSSNSFCSSRERRKREDNFFCSNKERRKREDNSFCSNRERRKREDNFFCSNRERRSLDSSNFFWRNRTSNSLTPSQTSLEPETSTRFSLRFPEIMDINMDMESRGILDPG